MDKGESINRIRKKTGTKVQEHYRDAENSMFFSANNQKQRHLHQEGAKLSSRITISNQIKSNQSVYLFRMLSTFFNQKYCSTLFESPCNFFSFYFLIYKIYLTLFLHFYSFPLLFVKIFILTNSPWICFMLQNLKLGASRNIKNGEKKRNSDRVWG